MYTKGTAFSAEKNIYLLQHIGLKTASESFIIFIHKYSGGQ